jgi:hypothetical protein
MVGLWQGKQTLGRWHTSSRSDLTQTSHILAAMLSRWLALRATAPSRSRSDTSILKPDTIERAFAPLATMGVSISSVEQPGRGGCKIGHNEKHWEVRGVASCWCERGDSNPHGFTRQILSLVRLPIPPLSQHPKPSLLCFASSRKDSLLHFLRTCSGANFCRK